MIVDDDMIVGDDRAVKVSLVISEMKTGNSKHLSTLQQLFTATYHLQQYTL